jgi:uncharacterized protein
MLRNPFRFGEPVGEDHFTDRYREREVLLSELTAGHNVLLTAPRAHGRTSLARKVLADCERQGLLTLYLDSDRAYSLPRLIENYLSELLRGAFRQPKDLQAFLESLAPEFRQRLSFSVSGGGELTVDLSRHSEPPAILPLLFELARLTSEYRKRTCVVCFDEISDQGRVPEAWRSALLAAARAQTRVGYLLIDLAPSAYAKREHFLHLPLGRIEERYFKPFIKTRFENTGFRVEDAVLSEILKLTGGHPNATQLLCRELWNQGGSGKLMTVKHLQQALEATLETQAGHYMALWRDLSVHQKNLLVAIANGGGKRIFSQRYVTDHHLGTFSTVQKSLNRLLETQVVARRTEGYELQDLFLQTWLKRRVG